MRSIFAYIVPVVLACAALATAAEEPAAAPGSRASANAPASQPEPLRIGGLPAEEWLNADGPVQGENLQGRLWVVGVLEPWSTRSRQAGSMLADVARAWVPKGVTAYLVTVQPAQKVREELPEGKITLPIGAGSSLPILLGLEPLPRVYLVGPEQAVVWSGPVWHLAGVLPDYYTKLTEGGLSHGRTNELTIRLNRATAALEHKEYFLAVGLASLTAPAAPPGHPLHRQAEDLLAKLDRAGSEMLVQGQRLLAEKRTAEGYDLLQTVAEQFYGTAPATQALRAIEQLRQNDKQWAEVMHRQDEASAAQTLELAHAALAEQRYVDAQRYYRLIVDLYPRTQATPKARQGLTRLRSDKALATQMAEQKVEPAALVLLNLAARYVQIGRYDQARQYYQQVIQQASGTTYAEQAREALKDLPASAPATRDSRWLAK